MRRSSLVRLMTASVLFVFAITTSAVAGMRSRVEPGVFAPLSAPVKDGVTLRITKLPLNERNETIVLEEFDVLAPNAVVEVFDADGKPHRVTPQGMRQYRGTVSGDPESIVYISSRGLRVNGIIISRDKKFSVWSVRASRLRNDQEAAMETYVEELSDADAAQIYERFTCGVEGMPIGAAKAGLPKSLASGPENVMVNAALTGTQRTVLNMAVETDSALYANFSSNAANTETFARDLMGAVSTIYIRDLQTEIRLPYLGVHTATDPFVVNPGQPGTWDGTPVTYDSLHAMLEFGDRWHNSPPSANARSGATLMSGQSQLAGIAWQQVTCFPDFLCTAANGYPFPYVNHYGGAYSYNGGIGYDATNRIVPNPDANPNFGAPNNGYWPLLQVAHELGHNVQSPHTHCTALTVPEQTQYNTSGRAFVDACRSGEGGGCYSGAQSLPAEAPGGRGTIMSYCHLLAFGNGTRFTFGQVGEAASKITTAMRTQLDAITPTISAITAPASVPPGVGGQAASVTNGGLTYDWTITNGTFTGGGTTATGASVTFTGTTNPVTLKVVGTNTSGCAITDSKSVTVAAVAVNPPTNVVATATSGTSVSVTWTNASGATSYNVYRSTNNSTYTKISTDGAVTGTPFTDSTASANTAYMYKVRSVQSGSESADSNKDFTVAMSYTDPTINAASTTIQAVHFTQLRTAVNALRTLNSGQGAFSFTDGTLNTTITVKGVHLTELRAELNTVRTALGFSTVTFTTDPTITTSVTVKKAHIDEMRAGLQ